MAEVPEEVQRIFAQAPFIKALGMRLESVGSGECVTTIEVVDMHLQQDGFVHAGVQATMADHTAGAAAASLMPPGKLVLSTQLSIQLLRPARGQRLRCRARVLKAGRTLTVVESEVFCDGKDGEQMVSKLTGTMAVVDARGPRGAESREKP